MKSRNIVHRKIVVRGGGIRDVILEYTKNGIQYLKYQTINGVRKLVPYAVDVGTHLGNKSIDALANAVGMKDPRLTAGLKEVNGSSMAVLGNLVDSNMHTRMGGRVAPTRNLILREINHALK